MQEEGYIAKLLYPEGSKDVKLGEVVAIIVENQKDVEKFRDFKVSGSDSDKRSCPATLERPSSEPDQSLSGRTIASPLAKSEASKTGVDLT